MEGLGRIWRVSGKGKHLERIWGGFGENLGRIRGASRGSGKHLGRIWAGSGQDLGRICRVSGEGKHLERICGELGGFGEDWEDLVRIWKIWVVLEDLGRIRKI